MQNNYSIDNNNPNPFETPLDNKSNMLDSNYTSSALRSKPKQSQNIIIEKNDNKDESNDNPYLEKSNNNNINQSKVNDNNNQNNDKIKNSQSNLFYESTEIEKDKNENPFNNDNIEMNNPFGEGFNKSLAQSVTNPYADNINKEVQKSQNNINNSMQGSIVDDVKFKENIPYFDDATNDFPKSE